MNFIARLAVLPTTLLAICAVAEAADKPVSLKDAFKDHFLVGTAINRNMATGTAGFRRTAEQQGAPFDPAELLKMNGITFSSGHPLQSFLHFLDVEKQTPQGFRRRTKDS